MLWRFFYVRRKLMAKFNKITPGSGPSAPLKATADPSVKTYEGGPGVVSDTKTEAFRLGVTLFGGNEPTFYEKGKGRDDRFNSLCAKLAVADPSWTFGFLRWLRADANIRTASIMGAAHAISARLQDSNSVKEDELLSSVGHTGVNRALVDAVCQRADEPGEFAQYWTSTFGAMPKCVKRGLADAANRLYNEYSVMKYDTSSHAFRFADVLNLTHAKPKGNADLFKYVIDRRFGNDTAITLPMIAANNSLRIRAAKDSKVLLDGNLVREAGMTWEDVLSLAGSKLPKDKVWEAVIPSMGYMALLRNLRNFEEAGISREAQKYVISKLSDKNQVEKSRQFPFRFLSAYFSINSLAYQSALEDALEYSVQNIPVLDGGTLVLVDTSGSMSDPMSEHSKMTRAGAGALFGGALANRNAGNATLVSFATTSAVVPIPRGGSVLNLVKEIDRLSGHVGHGTNTADAIKRHFDEKKHKRVVIFTDGQSFGGYCGTNIGDCVPAKTFMYGFDLSGYKHTDLAAGKNRRYQLAGLTDATFKQISYLENGENANWPWINKEGK
jgi:hypothetical protein